MLKACLFLFGLFLYNVSYAQTGIINESDVLSKLYLNAKAHPSNPLFVHTDKNIYTNNETIWFSAYLLKDISGALKDHTILSVALVLENNRKILLQDKFVMQNGITFGSLTLPDSIPPGNYLFIASTNVLNKQNLPVAIFTQPLTIKSITEQDFTTTLSLLDTVAKNGIIRAKVTFSPQYPDPKQKATIEYSIGKELNQAVILKENSCVINIPASKLNQAQPTLFVKTTYNKEIQYLSLKLPGDISQNINIRFFPESGSLSDGLPSTVGCEAKTSHNLPIALKGVLYENDLPIDTIETNSYGIGIFKLKPDSKNKYTLKVKANSYLLRDTIYKLPEILKDGVVLQLKEAVVKDKLEIGLFSKQIRTVQLLIHNYKNTYASFKYTTNYQGKKLNVALGPLIPKGIATITVLDEEGRPLAERLFFAHYDQKTTTSIQVDKTIYARREKVNVQLTVKNEAGITVEGIISVAVVQNNRIEHSKFQDIASYIYLEHDLGKLPEHSEGRALDNKNYLEEIFLVKGWRRYNWTDLLRASVNDTIGAVYIQSSGIKAQVKYNNKPLTKPVKVSILSSAGLNMITTEADGSFILGTDKLFITEGQKAFLLVNEKNKYGYTIETDDPFVKVNEKLASKIEMQNWGIAQIEQSSEDQKLKEVQKVVTLKTVTINADKKDNSLFGIGKGPNACGDYVCISGFLNCKNHQQDLRNQPPVKGQIYNGRVYTGCLAEEKTAEVFGIKGIYTSREFYGLSSDPVDLLEPQFLSTLFWKPGILFDAKGQTTFSFSTGDITGKFRIIVQGIGAKDMIFGENNFEVK